MAQTRASFSKSIYQTGDSWYHFNVGFENAVKALGLSSIFGFATDPYEIEAPTRTAIVCEQMEFKTDMACNNDMVAQHIPNALGTGPIMRTV
jgi:hypothetical protein